jgi:hypothetical protein
VRLRSRFCPISEVCREVANLCDPLPEAILSILYKETHAGDDMLALEMDETYRGGGRHLRRRDDANSSRYLAQRSLGHTPRVRSRRRSR